MSVTPPGLIRLSRAARSVRGSVVVGDALLDAYSDVLTPDVLDSMHVLSAFELRRRELMQNRIKTRAERHANGKAPSFLPDDYPIPGVGTVAEARAAKFTGAPLPEDLVRQWVQGTGPAARPHGSVDQNLRNVAYALLSGADGWMFDGEDALGQIGVMSLDAQRALSVAYAHDGRFLETCEQVGAEMNEWSHGFHGRPIVDDNIIKQLSGDPVADLASTTRIFRVRGMHLDDRHIRASDGAGMAAAFADAAIYVTLNHRTLRAQGRSIVLYLPKIQHVDEAVLWNQALSALENHLGLAPASIRTYALVEHLDATYQLMEIRAALGPRFVGFNTGRWDYINSTADALAGVRDAIHPNISEVPMTFPYMANYEQRVKQCVATPDLDGNVAAWQGGMEPQIPVGSAAGIKAALEKAVRGAERECEEGASGKWVAHWKMVHTIRQVWKDKYGSGEMTRAPIGKVQPLEYSPENAAALSTVTEAPRTIAGARDLISVAIQYGNAFLQGRQAVALKAADFFGNDDVLYLMEDAATGEIRVSILWEWLHKAAKMNAADGATGTKEGDVFNKQLFMRLVQEEYEKLQAADGKDVHEESKSTTLPLARHIVERIVLSDTKVPWYIDLLNLCLDCDDSAVARQRVEKFINSFSADGTRITDNMETSAAKMMARQWTSKTHEAAVASAEAFMSSPRFAGIKRNFTAVEVAEQQGTFGHGEYSVARETASAFFMRLRELFRRKETILTFGPYSPGQAVAMKKAGIEGIYIGGWATSAKGSLHEDPGPDLASYPLSQVPDEAGHMVRALLAADKNQYFNRTRMTSEERAKNTEVDFRPFIIADADTGHGGDAHVRNLVRRFVEVGVPGYHIEDQKPGVKKCGHQGGKVLVPVDEQIKRMNAARFQLDIMGVPGLIVARTDAEAATLLDGRGDERDQPFILGASNTRVPAFRVATMAFLNELRDAGVKNVKGFEMFAVCDQEIAAAKKWQDDTGLTTAFHNIAAEALRSGESTAAEKAVEQGMDRLVGAWTASAGVSTYADAVAAVIEQKISDGIEVAMSAAEWKEAASNLGWYEARQKARELGCDTVWDPEHAKTPDGYYQIAGGIPYAIAKSLAVAPYADLLWMETKTANLEEAKTFADAIHAVYPDKMLAYNMSPSFNWDTTGMSDAEMSEFATEMGKLGFVFNFITYGGHQIDGIAGEQFAQDLKQNGMLALAQVQRRLRLTESPYKTPQSLVGGPRADAGLSAVTGFTATTKAMGAGSTQHQHLVAVEVPVKTLEGWLDKWANTLGIDPSVVSSAKLRPYQPGSETLELSVLDSEGERAANLIFNVNTSRSGVKFLSVLHQNNFVPELQQKRLMCLLHLFAIHRYSVSAIHYVEPTDDNKQLVAGLVRQGLLSNAKDELGGLIVADVNTDMIDRLTASDGIALDDLINRKK